jgi:hypothetical protein
MSGVPSDEGSGLSFVIVLVRLLSIVKKMVQYMHSYYV